jgi:hypothetical protein
VANTVFEYRRFGAGGLLNFHPEKKHLFLNADPKEVIPQRLIDEARSYYQFHPPKKTTIILLPPSPDPEAHRNEAGSA